MMKGPKAFAPSTSRTLSTASMAALARRGLAWGCTLGGLHADAGRVDATLDFAHVAGGTLKGTAPLDRACGARLRASARAHDRSRDRAPVVPTLRETAGVAQLTASAAGMVRGHGERSSWPQTMATRGQAWKRDGGKPTIRRTRFRGNAGRALVIARRMLALVSPPGRRWLARRNPEARRSASRSRTVAAKIRARVSSL